MKTLTFLFSLIFLAVMSGNAQNENKPQGIPEIKFDETQHDFGEIIEGSPAEYSFTLHNTGKAPLLIKSAKPSCGCTTPDWTKEPIPPGGKGFVQARFNSMGYAGRSFSKTITVTTNVPDGSGQDKMVILFISGKVAAKQVEIPQYPAKLSLPSYNFGQVKQGKPVKWAVSILNDGDSSLILKQVKSANTNIVAKWAPTPVKKGGMIVIEFTMNTKGMVPNKITELITFVTNVPETYTKVISINGFMLTGEILKK